MAMLMTLAALVAAAAPAGQAAEHRGEAWALAYSGDVERSCPGWTRRTEAIPLSALPDAATWNGAWGDQGVLMLAWREGRRAAGQARRGDPGFCRHPAKGQPADRAALLRRILIPPARR